MPVHRHARVLRVIPEPERSLGYKAFERLLALEHWLKLERPVGTVLVMDPDVVFLRAVTGEAEEGNPRAQHWVDYHPEGAHTQAATWPMLIHTSDLERLLPQWIAFTASIYAATKRWESDMYGLVSAAASGNLTFSLEQIGAFVGWPDEAVGDAPIVHYCQDVVSDEGDLLWSKSDYQPWARVEEADRARHSYCRDLLAVLNEYVETRPSSDSTGFEHG